MERDIAELHAIIEADAAFAKYLIQRLPEQFDHRSARASFDEGWRVGFRRCLAEVKRIAEGRVADD